MGDRGFRYVSEAELAQHRALFVQFLDTAEDEYHYRSIVQNTFQQHKARIIVAIQHLRVFDARRGLHIAHEVIHNPKAWLTPMTEAIERFSRDVSPAEAPLRILAGITGSFGDHECNPRTLNSSFIGHMVCVEGIVTKVSLVNPKLVRSAQYSAETNQILRQVFHDVTDLLEIPTRSAMAKTDRDGNTLDMDFGQSTFVDHQVITIQERPEAAPPGQMPRSCEAILEDDLAGCVKPGDRVRVYGVYRTIVASVKGAPTGVYRGVVIGNNVEIAKQTLMLSITENDERAIKEVAQQRGVFPLLARSMAPAIYGYDEIKKSLVLMMVGGNEINLPDGTHIRGDINLLMVGDPGTAKSQMLRYVLQIAPLAVSTTGRGASGVGLTACVGSDPETGERRLEAGAMVIADRGVCCIDELDKMSIEDRVAIHEALEQQTVTIAKAGIHASLHARCAVCAAANPVYGSYNHERGVAENIALPSSLLSRFDLLFIVLDQRDAEIDQAIAEHVLRAHRWRAQSGGQAHGGEGVWVQPDPLLHQNVEEEMLTTGFLRKFLVLAKAHRPQLGDSAAQQLINAWAERREYARTHPRSLSLTPRAFETLVRLATAHAKVRLADEVGKRDARVAIELWNFALRGAERQRRKRGAAKQEAADDEGDDEGAAVAREVVAEEAVPEGAEPEAPPNPHAAGAPPPITQGMSDWPPTQRATPARDRTAEIVGVFREMLLRSADIIPEASVVAEVKQRLGWAPTAAEMDAFRSHVQNSPDSGVVVAETGGSWQYYPT